MRRPDPRAIPLLLLALAGDAGAAYTYCCTDRNGRPSCGDTLPEVCYGRAYRVIGSNGAVVREVEAPLTPAQRAQKAAEAEKRKAEEEARREQKRQDQALLNSYGSIADIDAMAASAERGLLDAIKQSESKIGEIGKRRKKVESEAEFYRKKPMPPEVAKGLRDADAEIKAEQDTIAARQKELAAVRAKYAAERQRYLELTGKAPAQPAPVR